jgi:hypothetical protein
MNFIKTIFISIAIMSMTSLYYGMCPCIKSECVCSYLYPSGYDIVMVDYISLLNTSQYFYQNQTMIAECPFGLSCYKNITLDPSLSLFTNITRYNGKDSIDSKDSKDSNLDSNLDIFLSTYKLNFSNNYSSEINVDDDEPFENSYFVRIVDSGNYNSSREYVFILEETNIKINMKFNESFTEDNIRIISFDIIPVNFE